MEGTVLLADDDRAIRTVLTQALTRAGLRVHATASMAQLLRWVEEGRGDLVVTDVVMPDGNGLEAIPAIRHARPQLPVIVISAQNTIVTAIRAAEAEVFDYLPKPFDLHELLARVRAGLGRRRRIAAAETPAAASPATSPATPEAPALPLVGRAPAMQALFRRIAQVLHSDLAVIVAGEAGSGRSTVARLLHDLSDRAALPLAVVSPAEPLPARSPAGGSLLVEDPAAMTPEAQARLTALLAAWEGLPHPPRLIAVTGPDPAGDAAAGRLRPDLHHRLAGMVLAMPPLRARAEDIPELVAHLLARAGAARRLSADALARLAALPFPGNLRELDQLLRHLSLAAPGPEITLADLDAALPATGPALTGGTLMPLAEAVSQHLQHYFDLHGGALPPAGLHARIIAEVERPLIELALTATGGNQLRCAELLGLNRNTLRKKLTEHNIEVTRRRRVM